MSDRQLARAIIGQRWIAAAIAVAAFIAASATAQQDKQGDTFPPIDRTLIEKIVFLSEAEAHMGDAISTECSRTGCDAALVTPLVKAAITAMDHQDLTEEIAARDRETDNAAWAIAQYARATRDLQAD
ncbi:MAG: hypothetical protein AAF919_15885 [Pseudomonadota bacterium]